eukprot:1200581-Amphidinium_carterae.1
MPLAVTKRSIHEVPDASSGPAKKAKGGGKAKSSNGISRNQLAGNRPDGKQLQVQHSSRLL